MELSKNEKSILLHTLGLNYESIHFRNHFCASKTHTDYNDLLSLCNKNLMKQVSSPSFCDDGNIVFIVTQEGIEKAYEILKQQEKKLTRAQKRYRLFLKSDCSETFKEWLQNKFWDKYRKAAGC